MTMLLKIIKAKTEAQSAAAVTERPRLTRDEMTALFPELRM